LSLFIRIVSHRQVAAVSDAPSIGSPLGGSMGDRFAPKKDV
jgi:hypothetical protein